MKKLTAFLLALALVFVCIPALAFEATDVFGSWTMVRLTIGDTTYNDPANKGNEKYFTLRVDGTAKVMINDNKYAATWTLENDTIHMVYEDGDTADISVTPDGLICTAGNQTQYFGRMKAFINFFSTAEKCLDGGLPQDAEIAAEWYQKAADLGYTPEESGN